MATVLVIDPSPSIRETLRIVLGHEHEVVVADTLDLSAKAPLPSVVVLGLPPPPHDDRAVGRVLARLPPDVPVLLLHRPDEVAWHEITTPLRRVEFLPKPFDAYAVRACIKSLLAPAHGQPAVVEAVDAHRRFLEFPFLSKEAVAIVRRAVGVDVPVLLHGEPGTGAPAVARALHALDGGRGPFVTVDAANLAAGDLQRRMVEAVCGGGGTLFLANLDRTPAAIQHELLDQLSQRIEDGLHVVAAAERDLAELAAAGCFLLDLAQLTQVLSVPLTPLRERRHDIPALVDTVTRTLAPRLGLEEVGYSEAARQRLSDYLWFGNVAELEAVVWRTLVLHRPRVVDVDQLVFFPEHATRATPAETAPRVPSPAPTPTDDRLATPNLEVLLGELAHELRNPMVTIKTFTQHLDSVLADPEVRERFSTLTADAVTRMDALLETLLDFARFRAPSRRPTDVRAMLDRVLGEQADELARRHVSVERNGAAMGAVEVDEAQVLFALRCLLRGLIEDLVPHAPLKIREPALGVVELEVRTEPSVATRLAAYVEPDGGASAADTPPLAWAMASALLRRNGGAVSVHHAGEAGTVIRVDWSRRAV